jgi:hypothetical protein
MSDSPTFSWKVKLSQGGRVLGCLCMSADSISCWSGPKSDRESRTSRKDVRVVRRWLRRCLGSLKRPDRGIYTDK